VVFAAGTFATLAMAEPGTKRPGVLAALRPTIAVPAQARATFAETIPCVIAGWALNGLFLSLGPSIAGEATDSTNRLWGGLVIFLLCGTAAAVGLLFRTIDPRRGMLIGCLFLLAGVVITLGSITTATSAALLGGAAVAGVGLGLAFQGTFRMTMALAAPEERAGLLAAIFTVGYLAFSVPALIAGVATTRIGLHETAIVYSTSLAVLVASAIGLIALRSDGGFAEARRSALVAVPPGPCTTPPCLQTFVVDERLQLASSEVRAAIPQSQTSPHRHVQDEGGRP
jgi:MFS family permease